MAAAAAVMTLAAVTSALAWWHAGSLARYGLGTTVAMLAGAAIHIKGRESRSLAVAAVEIERVRPDCRNVVITAEEILRYPERTSAWMATCVTARASDATRDLRPSDVIPGATTLTLCAGMLLLATLIFVLPVSNRAAAAAAALIHRPAASLPVERSVHVIVTVRPPSYVFAEKQTMTDPQRLDVLDGTRLTFSVPGDGSHRLRFGRQTLGVVAAGAPLDVVARESGYFAIDGADGGRRLMALSVMRDRLPVVRVEQPARDLLLPDASRTIPLRVSALDDLGLQALELRYTKVSGTGEQFEFEEGSMPLQVARVSRREWRGDARIALPALALGPGDSLVYRAVARDGRPDGGGLAASDTYFIEIAGPEQVPIDGVEMPPEQDRYALSQQMVVLKIERLRAREAGMPRDSLAEASADIAAEQRAVRANFVFLLGGHVEDEEVEAEQSSEISEGRLQNTARRDVTAAIREMTRAEQGLAAVNTTKALAPARAAVEALQRAFGKSRYLLRAAPARSRIDPSRRLTGQLAGAGSWRRDVVEPAPREGDAARAVLADLMRIDVAAIDRSAMEQLAERALTVDPASAVWHEVSQGVLELRDGAGTPRTRRIKVDAILTRIEAESARGLLPRTTLAQPASPFRRAWEARPR